MQCVILAGGLATRMRPITETIPKALIPIEGDTPFAHYQLEWLAKHGVTKAIYSIGYRGEMIREYVGNGSRWGLSVEYVDEGAQLRGTGGALRLAFDQGALDPEFLVVYGDSFLPIDFADVWKAFRTSGDPALMTVLRNEERWDQSNACVAHGRVSLYDKWVNPKPPQMKFIDYGLSALKREVVSNEISPNEPKESADLARLFHRLSTRNQLAAYEVTTRFYEIGSPAGLQDFRDYVLHV